MVLATVLAACHGEAHDPPAPAAAEPKWLKGQTHVHTSNSGDGDVSPADVAAWYAKHGFDFLVFTDHNRITSLPDAPLLAIPGVELTQNLDACVPPPEAGDSCLLHVNALFLTSPGPIMLGPDESRTRREMFDDAIALTKKLGGLAQLNHPNFHWAIDDKLMAQLAGDGAQLVEIANMASDNRNEGDAVHANTEALWDKALARGAHLWGIASDDAHHAVDGNIGWIRVRAPLDAAAIKDAVVRGDFYATNGVELAVVDRSKQAIEVSVASLAPGDHTFRLVADNHVVQTIVGRRARFDLTHLAIEHYARVDVTDGSLRRAWTQPVFF